MERFELPEDLSAVSNDDLDRLETDAIAAFDAASGGSADPDHPDIEFVDEMERLVPLIQAVRTERDSRREAATERAERAARAAEAIAVPDETPADEADNGSDDGDGDGDGNSEDDGNDTEQPTPVEEVAPPVDDPSTEPSTEDRRELVNASLARRAAARTPKPKLPTRPVSLIAAADVPGIPTGFRFDDLDGVGDALIRRTQAFPGPKTRDEARGREVPQVQLRNGVAMIRREVEDALVATGANDMEVLNRAADEARLPGGSLLAAGGWCAPSETIYDLCQSESTDGLLDLPTIDVSRGGIRFTKGPSFADIYCNTGFCQTEAEAIAGTEKPCFDVECPDFEEVRLDVCGLCINAPILTNRAYPELVRRYIEGGLVAHQHKVSARLIEQMVALSGDPVVFPTQPGAAGAVLASLEIAVEQFRYRFRMARNSTLEVVLPYWLRGVIRADLAWRTGVDLLAVSDAQIDAYLAMRGVRVQWVYDWQPLGVDCPPDADWTPVTTWPDTVQVLIYPAGAFVKGQTDVISLDAIYDSTNIRTNTFTALFFEEGLFVAQTCYESAVLEIPLCANGTTGAPAEVSCYTAETS